MTSADPQAPELNEEPPQPEEVPIYHVSFERLAQLKRSAVALIAERRLPSCPSMQTPNHELSDPQKLVEEIARFCAGEEGYIRNNMGIQEIMFRTLLAHRNEPMSLHELHYELTERWSTPIRPINVSEEGLIRILEADDYYGFARISTED